MLVLSRKRNQIIRIGEDIVIKITRIKGTRVLLAIEAPEHVKIRRGELIAHCQRSGRSETPAKYSAA